MSRTNCATGLSTPASASVSKRAPTTQATRGPVWVMTRRSHPHARSPMTSPVSSRITSGTRPATVHIAAAARRVSSRAGSVTRSYSSGDTSPAFLPVTARAAASERCPAAVADAASCPGVSPRTPPGCPPAVSARDAPNLAKAAVSAEVNGDPDCPLCASRSAKRAAYSGIRAAPSR